MVQNDRGYDRGFVGLSMEKVVYYNYSQEPVHVLVHLWNADSMVHLGCVTNESHLIFSKSENNTKQVVQQVGSLHPIFIQLVPLERSGRFEHNSNWRAFAFQPQNIMV